MLQRLSEDDLLLTFKEAEEYLRVSRATVYRLLGSGRLSGNKVGKGWRFSMAELRRFVASGAMPPGHEPPSGLSGRA